MKPKQIKVIDKNKLYFKWDNDTESYIDLKYLRDECPCASCKGETVLLKTYIPAKPANVAPENVYCKEHTASWRVCNSDSVGRRA